MAKSKIVGKTVHRNLVGLLEIPDWKAYAAELRAKAAHDEAAGELLAGLCREFPELREASETNVNSLPTGEHPLKKAA